MGGAFDLYPLEGLFGFPELGGIFGRSFETDAVFGDDKEGGALYFGAEFVIRTRIDSHRRVNIVGSNCCLAFAQGSLSASGQRGSIFRLSSTMPSRESLRSPIKN